MDLLGLIFLIAGGITNIKGLLITSLVFDSISFLAGLFLAGNEKVEKSKSRRAAASVLLDSIFIIIAIVCLAH